MNVVFIAQCEKRALSETRRILDQFAERRGVRTWQTAITQEGLLTVRRMLRKTARKNTAVACHWIRGINHSELLWVVGDAMAFNDQGAVPTNTTERNILRRERENDWHNADLIRVLVDLSGLLHDLGKSIAAFQQRLQGKLSGKNLIRHEWVSLRMFQSFVGNDSDSGWLRRLTNPSAKDDIAWTGQGLLRDGIATNPPPPFELLRQAPLAAAIGWLVVSHHRLLTPLRNEFAASMLPDMLQLADPRWNEQHFSEHTPQEIAKYWNFPESLPVHTKPWRQRAARVAQRLLPYCDKPSATEILNNPYVLHLSRLCLMLADHHYSSLQGPHPERVQVTEGSALLANTLRDGTPNQTLDEHLIGVAQHGAEVATFLPDFEKSLPRLLRHKGLMRRATSERFRWQDRAVDIATAVRSHCASDGAFIINMASTGCGKTLGNAKVMNALADPRIGMRCAFAMGLRTLTLQTGRVFANELNLDEDTLATLVGGAANRALFEYYESMAEATGSASTQDLLAEDSYIEYEGAEASHPLLRRIIKDPKVRRLLVAPVLVCTVDHLIPATDSQRSGRQIAPMLRLMSGDLVLDEPDDFDTADLPALTRLVHWAGLLGSRILVSSATLPPAIVQGLFEAYRNGRHHYMRNRAARPGGTEHAPVIPCIWIDEYESTSNACATETGFQGAHECFVEKRVSRLLAQRSESRRLARILTTPTLPTDLTEIGGQMAALAIEEAQRLHALHHTIDPSSKTRVSFGLVRFANIHPLYEVALAICKQQLPIATHVHLCVYHSNHPLLVRSEIEHQLDRALNRKDPLAVFDLPEVRAAISRVDATDHLFIVLGSPVTEVGRDHDYDWAIVEPSSVRSLIQLVGRVRRHRLTPVHAPNVTLWSTPLRHFRRPGRAAFCRPGFESEDAPFKLETHQLHELMNREDWEVIDAVSRIKAPDRDRLRPQRNLVDLEHSRLYATMLPQQKRVSSQGTRRRDATPSIELNAATWWTQAPRSALLTYALPQHLPFRKSTGPEVDVVMMPPDNDEVPVLHTIISRKGERDLYVNESVARQHNIVLPNNAAISPWGVPDYEEALERLARDRDLSLQACAKLFGTVSLPEDANGWRYHPALGFAKSR